LGACGHEIVTEVVRNNRIGREIMNYKKLKIMQWITRVLSAGVIAFGIPFYVGYGNLLPFLDPDYTIWDNIWLTIFPIMFIGLVIGLLFEKLGGFLITIPVGLGLIAGLILYGELVIYMLVPLAIGILLLIIGFEKNKWAQSKEQK
jgi:hypothetical protein